MRRLLPTLLLGVPLAAMAVAFGAAPGHAQRGFPATTVTVGGQPMLSDRELPDNLVGSADHHVLVDLLKLSGMFDQLHGAGPFTVFAPTDAAFALLPAGELDRLRRPENKAALKSLLSLHVVPSNYSSKRLQLVLRSSKGSGELETLDGSKLVVTTNGPSNMVLRDPKGGIADIVLYDAKQANGVLYVIDRVLQPVG